MKKLLWKTLGNLIFHFIPYPVSQIKIKCIIPSRSSKMAINKWYKSIKKIRGSQSTQKSMDLDCVLWTLKMRIYITNKIGFFNSVMAICESKTEICKYADFSSLIRNAETQISVLIFSFSF